MLQCDRKTGSYSASPLDRTQKTVSYQSLIYKMLILELVLKKIGLIGESNEFWLQMIRRKEFIISSKNKDL